MYVYILESKKDGKRYIGSTNNPRRRLIEHARGAVPSTRYRRPFVLIYIEGCANEKDARRREGYLKSTRGNYFLAKRLIEYYRVKTKL